MTTWYQRRKERAAKEAFNRGFSWAMIAYFLEDKTLTEIEAYALGDPEPTDSESGYEFDRGAVRALCVITEVDRARRADSGE